LYGGGNKGYERPLAIAKPSNFLALNTGLVGHWTFDGPKMLTNVADSSGRGNNGSLVLGASGNTSTTTVARVAFWLENGRGGYKNMLKKLFHHHSNPRPGKV